MSAKKMLGVTFNMSDPLERDIYHFVENRTDNFSSLVKHLLFSWRHGYIEPNSKTQTTRETYEIKNSGIPFG